MKKLLALLVIMPILMFALVAQVGAANWTTYVKGRVIPSMERSGQILVPVKAFLDVAGIGYQQDASGVVVLSKTDKTRTGLSLQTTALNCSFSERPATLGIVRVNGAAYTKLQAICALLQLTIKKYPATAMIEVTDEAAQAVRATQIAKSAAAEKIAQANSNKPAAKFDREHPVKQLGEIEGILDQVTTWQAYWTAKVKNYADVPVHNVVMILHIQTADGKDVDTQMKSIGTMNPGDTASGEFYWQSPNHVNAFPKLEIKHQPLPPEDIKKTVEVRETAPKAENKDAKEVTKEAPVEKTEAPASK